MSFKTRIEWGKQVASIKEKGLMGKTMAAIARDYGVSRQRLKQIIDVYIPDWSEKYGYAVNRQAKADIRYAKWGVKEDSELYAEKRKKFRGKKANCTRIGWEWSIEFGDVDWPTHCPILGIELEYFADGIRENSVSFDRIDSSKGYVKGNVQIISWRANRIKNNGTAEEHMKIAEYLTALSKPSLDK